MASPHTTKKSSSYLETLFQGKEVHRDQSMTQPQLCATLPLSCPAEDGGGVKDADVISIHDSYIADLISAV